MSKWEPLNMQLRSRIIAQVLRLEQTTSDLLISIFRINNKKPKTLGDKSSALSLKNKIDLLFDLGEIDKTDYTNAQKIMEIRNQFVHNHSADSFTSFKSINPELIKFLVDNRPKDLPNGLSEEEQYLVTFIHIHRILLGKLLLSNIEYSNGVIKEMRKHLNDLTVENFDGIWQKAVDEAVQEKIDSIDILFMSKPDLDYSSIYSKLRMGIAKFQLEELKNLDDPKKLENVYKRKETPEETLERMDAMKKVTKSVENREEDEEEVIKAVEYKGVESKSEGVKVPASKSKEDL